VLADNGCVFLSGPGVWNCGSQNLSGATLYNCDLTNASFFNADLSGATVIESNLTGANFFDATVVETSWDDVTCPSGTNSTANDDSCCDEFINGQVPEGCAN
jgi:uncharacterized protein YjbI with pentapeptide repeats